MDEHNIRTLELIPLGQHDNCVGTRCCIVRILGDGHKPINTLLVLRKHAVEILENLFGLDFGVIDGEACALLQEMLTHINAWGLTRIASVLLKGKAKHGDFLVCNSVEEAANDTQAKATLLVVVHDHHLPPVCCNLREVE